MKYASNLYYLLYPYLLQLLQYPLHAAHNNMQQTYDLHSYLFIYSTVYLVIGISLFFLHHCYQQINIANRCYIEIFNFIILAIYFMNFIGGIQILPVISILLSTTIPLQAFLLIHSCNSIRIIQSAVLGNTITILSFVMSTHSRTFY